MSDSFRGILGQDPAVAVLQRSLASDRLASSYLFSGPPGVGKQLTAVALAKAAIGAEGPTEHRIDEGLHPDVRVFEPRPDGKRNIPVDTLRSEILPLAQFAPFEARAAFLIFPEADVSFPEHPPETSNALLKTLEEPRPGVHFVLLSERPERLLPTIRSRCQRLRFQRLTADVLDGILLDAGVDDESRGPAVALAEGRADRALSLADGGAEALLEAALAIDHASTEAEVGARLGEVSDVLNGDLEIVAVLEALVTFYRDVAAAGLGRPPDTFAFHHRAEHVQRRAEAIGARTAAERVEAIQEALLALERNANPRIVLDGLAASLRG